MGKPAPHGKELAVEVRAGSFTGVGPAAWVQLHDDFNITLTGSLSAVVVLERSFDGGDTAVPCCLPDYSELMFTAPKSFTLNEPERGVLYRFNCVEYAAGPVHWRLSQ